MGRRRQESKSRGARRTKFWIFGAVVFVAALLYWEQTALLYVLSTLAMCALLSVVAFSDLEGRNRELHQPASVGGAEEIDSTTSASPVTPAASAPQRRKSVALKRRVS